MPGILKRSHDRMESGDLDSNPGAPEKKRQALDSSNGTVHGQVNGGSHAPNGADGQAYTPNPDLTKALEQTTSEMPPEIFHITQNYISLSTLVERLAQETFIELEQLINELSEMQSHQVNGYGSSQSVEINVRKKERIWRFAHGYRAKFIKLLVLSQWSRHSEAVSKVIDINGWINLQRDKFNLAQHWIGEIKRMTLNSKLPASDLSTALEILSTGKSEWYSDLGYIPKDPYTPKQLLKALRTINTLLTIRLNVHEDVPPEMMDFSISSGRATFRVKDEFELDLSIADEELSSQLFFIDFRFAFAPCMKEVPEGPLRNHIEGKTNEILRTKGLAGCYEFLHELVLTHKLNILRNQAWDLARGRWSENIRVEPVHRSVVIHYWTNRPGSKSWIEIGTRKRRKNSFPSSRPISHLAVRWHRHNKEVLEHNIEVDPADLSIESVLKEAVAGHINHIFRQTKRNLKENSIYSKGELSIKHRAHPKEPAECSLKMQISQSATATITQEPISGFFAISPSSNLHFWAENNLNRLKDPTNEAAAKLALLRCTQAIDQVRARAKMRRWQTVQTLKPNQETTVKFFGKGVLRIAFYRLPKWGKEWILALTAGLSGDQWWAVETQDAPRKLTTVEIAAEGFQPIRKTLKVNIKTSPASIFDASYSGLSLVEQTAAAVVSRFVDARELTRAKIVFEQRSPTRPLPNIKAADYFIHFKPDVVPVKPKETWCHDVIKSSYLGLSRSHESTVSIVTARLLKKIPNVNQLTSTMESAIAFHPETGDFSFRLQTPLGKASVLEIKKRFDRISSLVRFINVIASRKLVCSRIALDSLKVIYSGSNLPSEAALTASIHFPPNDRMRIVLEAGNPHLRIIDFLNTALNTDERNGFEHVLAILQKTLNLLRGLEVIERQPVPNVDLKILPRSATYYRVRYSGKSLTLSYDIRMKERPEEGLVWFATLNSDHSSTSAGGQSEANKSSKGQTPSKSAPNDKNNSSKDTAAAAASKVPPPSEEYVRARESWTSLQSERGEGWYGLGAGILALDSGVEACVLKMHETLSAAVVEADETAAKGGGGGGKSGSGDQNASSSGSSSNSKAAATKSTQPSGSKPTSAGTAASAAAQGKKKQQVITVD